MAHRLSTVVGADLIIVMDDGEVVATGTHAQLLATSDVYAELVQHQLPVTADTAPEPADHAALPAGPPAQSPLASTAVSITRLLAGRASDALARLGNRRN